MQSRASHQQVPITYEHRSAAVPQPRARLSRVSAQRASLGTESDAIPHAGGVFVNHNAKLGQGSPLTATRSGADLSILTFGAKHPLSSTYQRMQDTQDLSVIGVRTGEERVAHGSPSRLRQSEQGSFEEANLRRQLTQSKAECKMLSEKLSRKKGETQRVRALYACIVDELEKRLATTTKYFGDREDAVLTSTLSVMESLRCGSDRNRDLLKQMTQEVDSIRSALAASQQASAAAAQQQADHAKQSADHADLNAQIESLKRQLADEQQSHAKEKLKLELDLRELHQTQHHLMEVLETQKTQIMEDQLLVSQCRVFVKNVCHPGFNVVKGPSLEPVDKARSEPSGFVLVPLVVLLHGYALLPTEERKVVIEQYEREAAKLK